MLIISHDILNERSRTVIALCVTSRPQKAGYPLTYQLKSRLPQPSWIKINQIRTLSTDRLGKKIGHVSGEELMNIVEGLMDLVG